MSELAIKPVTPNGMELLAELARKTDDPSSVVALGKAAVDLQIQMERFAWEREERQAKIDFDEALNHCQSRMKRIAADMTNPQTHSRYASYAALDRAIRPIYTEEGFSISFGEDEGSTSDYIVMLAYLSRGGITRTYRKGMPIDPKGPKGNDVMTKTHAAGSAGSYAKRYLLKDIFNLAIGEDDDDGNGSFTPEVQHNIAAILKADSLEALEEIFKPLAKEAFNSGDQATFKAYVTAKDSRKAELMGAE